VRLCLCDVLGAPQTIEEAIIGGGEFPGNTAQGAQGRRLREVLRDGDAPSGADGATAACARLIARAVPVSAWKGWYQRYCVGRVVSRPVTYEFQHFFGTIVLEVSEALTISVVIQFCFMSVDVAGHGGQCRFAIRPGAYRYRAALAGGDVHAAAGRRRLEGHDEWGGVRLAPAPLIAHTPRLL
jgi:hypothetical protein